MEISQCFGIKALEEMTHSSAKGLKRDIVHSDETVGCVKWPGLSCLTLKPDCSQQAICQLETTCLIEQEMLLVETVPASSLPAGVLLQRLVVGS